MPSPHPRIGLVLDDDLRSALDALGEHSPPSIPRAGLARKAVLEGAALDAILQAARAGSAEGDVALGIVREIRALLPSLGVPSLVAATLIEELDRVGEDAGSHERRERQLALLATPNPHGRNALAVTEDIEAFDDAAI